MAEIITVNGLTKRYGELTAVNGISFVVHEGETFGILGPNGAGKTTTLEMMEGLREMDSGTVTVDGHDVRHEKHLVKSIIGVQLQKSDFFENLKLPELLDVFASMYNRKIDAMKILEQVQLTEKAKNQVKELSGGQKQRFSIAAALVNEPRVIFLDEPTTGLDPQARHNLWGLVEKIKAKGTSLILTTHYMEEAEVLCDRIAIMDNAKIVALDTTKNLLANSGVHSTVTFSAEHPCTDDHYQKLAGVIEVRHEENRIKLLTDSPEETLPALYKHHHEHESKIFALHLGQATLEDVFLKLTGHALRD